MTTETHHTLDNTRRMASQAMERASGAAHEWRQSAQELASRGLNKVSDRATAAQRQLGQYATTGTRYVAEHPLKSALIAAAVGAAVAGVVIALRHRSDHGDF
jgi:ElaB/YqjD/DUF883 family membrane-anchored ribosome-binding protein